MPSKNPLDVVTQLTDCINRGDLDRAVSLYEPGATLVPRPGATARGASEIRGALAAFIAMKPTLTSHAESLVESGDLALYMGRWNLRGADSNGSEVVMGGESTDILRRQADGRWLIAVDNPWGTQILPR